MTRATDREVSEPGAAAVVPRPAATVVLLRTGPRGPEVLLTHRPATMAFGPGLHVFPGGAVDPGDADPSLIDRLVPATDPLPATHRGPVAVAAIRELYEEAGVLLARRRDGAAPGPVEAGVPFAELVVGRDLVLEAGRLVPLSRWVTPPGLGRRYDARFFVAALPPGAVAVPHPGEVAAHEWLRPDEALAAMAARRIELWPPTSTTLQQLAPARGLDDVRRHLAPSVEAGMPRAERLAPGIVRLRFTGAGGVAGQAVDGYLVGRRRLALVDPGDPSDEAALAVLDAVEAAGPGARIEAILLTAPVPDHAAGAEGLALRLGVPIRAAAGARAVLPSDLVPVADDDLLEFADLEIRVVATPGTHPDHVAFAVRGADAVLVGDLEGPGPSRAIPTPVDADALRRSRARVAASGARRLAAHADAG